MNLSKADLKQLNKAIKETHKIMMDDLKKNFKLIDQDEVDGCPWYVVQIQNREVWFWLTQQEGKWRHFTAPTRGIPIASMEERIYLALVMRWS